VNRIFGTYAVLILMGMTSFAFAQNRPTTRSLSLEVTISVHDYADVPTSLLAQAEAHASGIFRQAGFETVWLNCGPKVEAVESKTCYRVDATHLMLKILAHALGAHVRDRNEVLGTALLDEKGVGYYAYAFYDRIRQLADQRKLGYALLGDVLAHEIGHLLLGSNSHSVGGIMCAHWNDKELANISHGAMWFLSGQSKIMQDRLLVRQSERMDLAAVVPDVSSTITMGINSSSGWERRSRQSGPEVHSAK
jgi:hypothetical protein